MRGSGEAAGGRRLVAASVALAFVVALVVAAPAAGSRPDSVRGVGASAPRMPHPTTSLDLDRIRGAGVDHVSIDVWWDFDVPNATVVHPGTRTLSDRDLADAIEAARRAGIRVILTPKLWCVPCLAQGFTWRGRLSPGDVSAFFASYRSMVNRYADLARDHGVDIFFIGSEMSLVQHATDEWRRVAREARARFPRRLAYEVNWDVIHDVRFWDAVDIVGVSAYFPLSDAERPSVAELKAGWRASRTAAFRGHQWFDRLAALTAETRKPLLFGEAGYMTSTYAARAPYDPSQVYTPDQHVQANAYQALLETFGSQPWWLGVVWWEWSFAYGGQRDFTYTPRGKAAEQVLRRFYRARS